MNHKPLIIILSLVVPILVALLYITPRFEGFDINFLPLVNASINATVFILLIFAIKAIKRGNRNLHEKLIYLSLILSTIFLLSYVIHHATHDPVSYGGEGFLKYFYYFILISHILLSIALIPMVLTSYVRAIQMRFDPHKKIAKITFPIWLYVAITGVVIYIMISPYY